MEAILAGRQDLAFKLADLGFVTRPYAAGINYDQGATRPVPAHGTSNPDAFSGNARFIKAAICAGTLSAPDPADPCACSRNCFLGVCRKLHFHAFAWSHCQQRSRSQT